MIRQLSLSLLFGVIFSTTTNAGVTIDGTRIIFPSNAKSVNVQLRNGFNEPALVQTWIDDGNAMEIPNGETIPFILNPSLTRIEAKKGQVIRIIPTNTTTLATDRESLYWFNLLDIPPESPEFSNVDKVKFNVRTRIKMFYRPATLKIQPHQAYQSLKFSFPQPQKMMIDNPTPYFITITKIQEIQQTENLLNDAIVIPPYEKINVLLNKSLSSNTPFKYTIINDIGTPIALSPQHIE